MEARYHFVFSDQGTSTDGIGVLTRDNIAGFMDCEPGPLPVPWTEKVHRILVQFLTTKKVHWTQWPLMPDVVRALDFLGMDTAMKEACVAYWRHAFAKPVSRAKAETVLKSKIKSLRAHAHQALPDVYNLRGTFRKTWTVRFGDNEYVVACEFPLDSRPYGTHSYTAALYPGGTPHEAIKLYWYPPPRDDGMLAYVEITFESWYHSRYKRTVIMDHEYAARHCDDVAAFFRNALIMPTAKVREFTLDEESFTCFSM